MRRASTREDIRRKLANFGDEQEEQRKTTEELSLNNNLEVGGVPHEILFGSEELGIFYVISSSKLRLLLLSVKESFVPAISHTQKCFFLAAFKETLLMER